MENKGHLKKITKKVKNTADTTNLKQHATMIGTPGRISDIIEKERLKLHSELSKLSDLRTRTHFSPILQLESSLDDSSDVEEFVTSPTSPLLRKNFQINFTVRDKNALPSLNSHKTPSRKASTSSEELLLSTYEDSLLYSPSHCTSPTYIRSNLTRNKPKDFFKNQTQSIFTCSDREESRCSSKGSKDELLSRLSSGSRQRISKKEMIERNKRLYLKLPEVQEKIKKEKIEAERKIKVLA